MLINNDGPNPGTVTALIIIYIVIALLILTGCTTSYKHMSNPGQSDDGYDLVCQGFEVGKRIEIEGNFCHNVASYGGNYVLGGVTYHWSKEK